MAEQLPHEQVVTHEELHLSQALEITALVNLLESKGILTKQEVINEVIRLQWESNAVKKE